MGSEAGTTLTKDMGTKVNIVTCAAWKHLTAWNKSILKILDDNHLTTGSVKGDVVAVLLQGASVKDNCRKYLPQEEKQPIL